MPPETARQDVPLTFDQFGALFPNSKANTVEDFTAFVDSCVQNEISTPLRLAAFCGEISYESMGRTRFVENLNYTPSQLCAQWKWKFPTREIATEYVRKGPQAIANKAYANVNGNGDEASGDGWRYRGRGDIQLTGRSNYLSAQMATGLNLIDNPDQASEPSKSIRIAAWYWASRGLNAFADRGDIAEITRRIQGGLSSLPQREVIYQRFKDILGASAPHTLDRAVFQKFMSAPQASGELH